MIKFNKAPGMKVLELGCGARRHEQADVAVDVRPGPGVDFVVDLSQPPYPIASGEFDGVYCAYALEHVPFAVVPAALGEVFRVLKPGGRALFLLPDAEAQFRWIAEHPEGWDGKDQFTAASELIFGSQDMPTEGGDANTHRAFFSSAVAERLFAAAGFRDVKAVSWNERGTDLLVDATKPAEFRRATTLSGELLSGPVTTLVTDLGQIGGGYAKAEEPPPAKSPPHVTELYTPAELYDRSYWNGGGKVGGYAREGYWDYPVHEITAAHVLARRPESVLELGAARGYVGKRIEDAGVRYLGLEVSRHCYLTRVCDAIKPADLCGEWDLGDLRFDLAFSIAVFEHVPERHVPGLIAKLKHHAKRGLFGIDFGAHDDGFDQTHATLRPRNWWLSQFETHAPGWPVEVVDKEDLERGEFPAGLFEGDGKVKLNLGCCATMFHRGWVNLDELDMGPFAAQHRYRFQRHDLRAGLPCATGGVDLIFAGHVLEHFNYADGLRLLRECRRVLRPEGALRVVVPDVGKLAWTLANDPERMGDFDEVSPECAAAPTPLGKFWALATGGHHAGYDERTLTAALVAAGFEPEITSLRKSAAGLRNREAFAQIRREVVEMGYGLSLFADAVPLVG